MDAYKSSWWDRNYSESGIKNDVQGFYDDQFVAYRIVSVVGGTASQNVAVPGYRVEFWQIPHQKKVWHFQREF